MVTLARDLQGRKSAVTASVLCLGPVNTNISRHSVATAPNVIVFSTNRFDVGAVVRDGFALNLLRALIIAGACFVLIV